jgi:signal transduction histidine kinase
MNIDRKSLQKKILKEVKYRYILAVGLIATFSIITFMLNQNLNQKMREDFKVINLSGRQRMLSQKIALLAGKDKPEELKRSIGEFKAGLDFLLRSRFVKPEYTDVYPLYFGENQLQEITKRYIALAERLPHSEADQEELFLLSQNILHKFDTATLHTQHISEIESQDRLRLEILFLSITLLLLTLEVIFIFRPMAKRVRQGFAKLNRIEEKSLIASRLTMIGEIASSISHEIKNPLSIIMIYAQQGLQATQDKDHKSHGQFLNISKNVERINKIVNALSVQSRETSKDPMTFTPVKSIVDDAIEMFSAKMKYQGITLKTDFKYEGNILCQSAAISQVIANLIANAIDAVSETHSEVKEIKIESESKGDDIFVRVIDSGQGVSPEIREKIFESFITTKQAGKGTGLGLAISRKIMEAHGGEIYLTSEASQTCFEMKFSHQH